MTQKKDEQNKQPWEASFNEDTNEEVAPSRAQLRKRSSRTGLIVGMLILVVIILAAYPVFSYVKSINSHGSAADEPVQTQVSTSVPTSSSSSKEKKSSSESSSTDEATSSSSSNNSAAASSAAAASSSATASSVAAASSAAVQSSIAQAQAASEQSASEASSRALASSKDAASSSSSTSGSGQFATVTVNAYRLGLKYGLSLGQLQTLNPGVDLNSVRIGEQLRIK